MYLLKNKKYNELYISSKNNLKRRIQEHNEGKVKSTKNKKPYKLIYYEAYEVEADARRRERMLKLRGQARHQLKLRLTNTLANKES